MLTCKAASRDIWFLGNHQSLNKECIISFNSLVVKLQAQSCLPPPSENSVGIQNAGTGRARKRRQHSTLLVQRRAERTVIATTETIALVPLLIRAVAVYLPRAA